MRTRNKMLALGSAGLLALGLAACGDDDGSGGSGGGGDLSGEIQIDGSSTVEPITSAIAELFNGENSGVQITVGTSGTSGGFEKFCKGETDISNASRAIKDDEAEACERNGVDFEEVTVATDALTVVVNPENPVDCLSVDQVSEIYGPGSTITNWNQVSGVDYDQELEIYSPGSDSGTFGYFTEAVNGEEEAQRTKGVNIVGEDDNATVNGVSGSTGGVGYFGFSFFNENQGSLKALQIENEDGECVSPSVETAQDGTYNPLARPLYVYPAAKALKKDTTQEFIRFYIENVNGIAEAVGFIGLTEEQLSEARAKVEKLVGS